MDSVLQWGLDLIIAVQRSHSPVLDGVFRAITFMGQEEFYLVLAPLVFWCVDFGLAARLAILFLLSNWLNVSLKDLFQQPRPFHLDQTVMLSFASGYGLPSGHAQSAVVIWGSVALWGRRPWLWVLAIGLIVLIGFSRVYLGVHFPTDVLAGWVIGAASLAVYSLVVPASGKALAKLNMWIPILLAALAPIALVFIHPVRSTASAMGTLAGLGVGLALTHRYVSFSVDVPRRYLAARFLAGGTIVFALYMGLKAVFPGEESDLFLVFRFLRYGVIGVWMSFGALWMFQRLRLN